MRTALKVMSFVVAACLSWSAADAQVYNRVYYPQFELNDPYAGRFTGDTERLGSNHPAYMVRRIEWRENRNRPCFMQVELVNINNPNDIRDGGSFNRCSGNTGDVKVLDLTSPNYRRGGAPVQLTVCTNNGRIKGLRAHVYEMQGTRVARPGGVQNGFRDFDFVPDIDEGNRPGLPDVVDLAPGPRLQGPDAGRWFMEEKHTNCSSSGWEDPRRCFRDGVITGIVAEIALNGTVFDVHPVCSNLQVVAD